ncbi:HAD family hydrolase [Agromyces seonyuensis]|uniref:HAD hydrolase family protein n=1 Tax=Agromyces seonyuensis TaxID=2662446 RepID=A0A6I4NV29_9MICO|nr:HAD family hydrolase [Agromyces seonyuensis]MWB98103.1 HAD hydrolase family protein [Agromyces seonyuensis]
MAERWLVALDVDGTVLHEDGSLDEEIVRAVGEARDRGHEVTLATGRSWATTQPVLERLGIEPAFVVCANGALTLGLGDDGAYERVHVEVFDPTAVLERIRGHLPNGKFMVELPDGFRLYTAGMQDWNLDDAREVPFAELLGVDATRVVVISPDHEIEEFLGLVEGMGLHQVSYAIGWTAWLDIAPDGVSKATALERVRDRLGIPSELVLVAGDGRNDLEMLHWAGSTGRAVAMGQAPAEVRAAATEVAGTVGEAGLAPVLDTLP